MEMSKKPNYCEKNTSIIKIEHFILFYVFILLFLVCYFLPFWFQKWTTVFEDSLRKKISEIPCI